MTDTPAHYSKAQRRLLTALGGLGVVALAAATFVVSYDDLRALAIRGGAIRHWAFLYPGMVDGLVVVVILSILSARRARWASRALRWALLLVLIAGAGAAGVQRAVNGYGDLSHTWVSGGVAAAPWVVLALVVWLWVSMIKQVLGLRTLRRRPLRPAPASAAIIDQTIIPGLSDADQAKQAETMPLRRPTPVRELEAVRNGAPEPAPGAGRAGAAAPSGPSGPSGWNSVDRGQDRHQDGPTDQPDEVDDRWPAPATAPAPVPAPAPVSAPAAPPAAEPAPPSAHDEPEDTPEADPPAANETSAPSGSAAHADRPQPETPAGAAGDETPTRRPEHAEPTPAPMVETPVNDTDEDEPAPRLVARTSLPTDVRLVGPVTSRLADTNPDGIKLPDTDPDGIPIVGTTDEDDDAYADERAEDPDAGDAEGWTGDTTPSLGQWAAAGGREPEQDDPEATPPFGQFRSSPTPPRG